ncbi:hypothetical protein [Pseudomonas sp. NA-150]|uniref:hypothetical protein n=1 Tax=Pseudomonas sp. NA-150 TaxID=3367525 RepID=UPI0037C74521
MTTDTNKSTDIDNAPEYCTVVFKLNGGRADANRFVYALACRVEQIKYVEVVTLEMGDLRYEQQAPKPSISNACERHANQQGEDHEQS